MGPHFYPFCRGVINRNEHELDYTQNHRKTSSLASKIRFATATPGELDRGTDSVLYLTDRLINHRV